MIQAAGRFSPLNPLRVLFGTHQVGPDGRLYQREDIQEVQQFSSDAERLQAEQDLRNQQAITLAKILIAFALALLAYRQTKNIVLSLAPVAGVFFFFQPNTN